MNSKKKTVGRELLEYFLFAIGVFVIASVLWFSMPPAVNIYKSISTDEVVWIETDGGTVTDPAEIKKILSGRYDSLVCYVE